MTDKKIILVTGVTGAQGGAVAKALLESGEWKIRGLTRNPESQKAKEIASQGVELVKGDLNDVKSIKEALKGVYGAYLVTDYWANPNDFDAELKQGIAFVDASKENNISHLIYSTIDDPNLIGFHKPIRHIESKAKISKYIRDSQVPFSEVLLVSYMDNWNTFYKPKINNGVWEFSIPMHDKKLETVAVRDVGPVVAKHFSDPERWLGKKTDLAGDSLTLTEMANIFSRVTGYPARHVEISDQDFKENRLKKELGLSEEAASEIINLLEFFRYCNGNWIDVAKVREAFPHIHTWESFLKETPLSL